MEVYREAFRVEYTGEVTDLTEAITAFVGVESVSAPRDAYVERSVDLEIEYNTHETDRTRIAMDTEDLDGVSEVTFI